MRPVAVVAVVFAVMLASCAFAADGAGPQVLPGKFYIVGMGTVPDLMTVRAVKVCERTDIFLLEEPGDAVAWKSVIGNRPVIYCPHTSRVYYGADISKIEDPTARAVAERNDKSRKDIIRQIAEATRDGKIVSSLQWGDPMVYGTTFYLEMLPRDVETEIVPGLGAFEAGSAAIKWSPTFGGDTNSVILTMGDWPDRSDTNDKLFALRTSVVIYTCGWKFKEGFEQLRKYYPPETPVAVVCYAGVPNQEAVLRGTVGDFIEKVDCNKLPYLTIVFVGKFIGHGQARNDFVASGKDFATMIHDSAEDHSEGAKVPEPEAEAIGLRTECATPIK